MGPLYLDGQSWYMGIKPSSAKRRSVHADVQCRLVDAVVFSLYFLHFLACWLRVIFGLLQFFLLISTLGNHHFLVLDLLLVIALTMELPYIVDLHLAFKVG